MRSLNKAVLEALEPRQLLTTLYWQGGTGNWHDANWTDGTNTNLSWAGAGGSDAVFNCNANVSISLYDWISPSSVTITGGNVTLDAGDGAEFNQGTCLDWSGGNATIYGIDFEGGTVVFEGQSGTLNFTRSTVQNGGLYWTSGNVHMSGGGVFEYDDLELDGGNNTLTLDGSGVTKEFGWGGDCTWSSGTIALVNGASLYMQNYDDPDNGGGMGIPEGSVVTLNVSSGCTFGHDENTYIVNCGTMNWNGTGMDQVANVTNDGAIIFGNVDLSGITLYGGAYEVGGTAHNNGGLSLLYGSTLGVNAGGTLDWGTTNLSGLTSISNGGTIAFDCSPDLSGLTFSGGTYEVADGYTAQISSTVTVSGGALVVDAGATLDWTGGDLDIGTNGSVVNNGTLSITTSGELNDSSGTGFVDHSSLAYQVTSEMENMVTGFTAPTFSGTPPYDWSSVVNIFNLDENGVPASHNTSGWWGDTDMTAFPVNSTTGGILVTPRDMIFAAHSGPNIGDQYTFIDADGNKYTRQVAWIEGAAGDILVATLGPVPDDPGNPNGDIDLPSSIHPLDLMPADFGNSILSLSAGIPVAFTNQDGTLLIGSYDENQYNNWYSYYENDVHVVQSDIASLEPFYYTPRFHDSGSPVTMLVNGKLVLLANWHSAVGGPDDALYLTEINDTIALNAAWLTARGVQGYSTPYTVSTADLSGFTDYSALL